MIGRIIDGTMKRSSALPCGAVTAKNGIVPTIEPSPVATGATSRPESAAPEIPPSAAPEANPTEGR